MTTLFWVSGLVIASALTWAARMWLSPTPWPAGASAVIGLTLLCLGTIAGIALATSGARWARRLALGMAAIHGLLAAVSPIEVLWVVAVLLSGAAAIGLAGPFLRGRVRLGPAPTGPPAAAIVLALGLVAGPGVVGAASLRGLSAGGWAFSVVCWVLALAYSKAWPGVLVLVRLGLPLAAVVSAVASLLPEAIAIVATSVPLTVLAWRKEARLAIRPLLGTRR